ncbi:phospholipase C [Apostasia shenzhenica]|uniref:Phospholipase C n=1 Tax=Apostasia shenzhenica TaxID=1088818 RepID=A0A2I0BBZ2_9ASPA|nr:phospholipase C [Apostasia shenzhenica]
MERSSSSNNPTLFFLLAILLLQAQTTESHHPIKSVVVLVLENRSFDHMLGWMKQSLNPSIDGLTGAECNRRSTADAASQPICVSDDAGYVEADPGHSFEDVMLQVFGSGPVPSMSGFVQQALTVSGDLSSVVMKGFRPEKLPVFSRLVDEFAVFDRWFSSIPGPTQPNRLFVYSATSHGATRHDVVDLLSGYPQKTIFDSLHEEGLDFAVYFRSVPTTLFYRTLRRLKYVPKFHWYSEFREDAMAGKLPSLSVIEPRYFDVIGAEADDDHPTHDVANGQRLVKEVYEALRASPQWNESLLIVTYDEHGGFYDHVETPYVGVPNPDGISGPEPFFFKFGRLGVRIPTIMVSPWIKKGSVVSRPGPNRPTISSEYEHSSIPATLKKMFSLRSSFLTKRDAWAGTFEHIFEELSSPRNDCPKVLPDPSPTRSSKAKENAPLSEFQQELVHLAAVLGGGGTAASVFNLHGSQTGEQMTVKEADAFVNNAINNYLKASKDAINLGCYDEELSILDIMNRSPFPTTTFPSP